LGYALGDCWEGEFWLGVRSPEQKEE
jgi:hypothetical protein